MAKIPFNFTLDTTSADSVIASLRDAINRVAEVTSNVPVPPIEPEPVPPVVVTPVTAPLAWGAKVSAVFRDRIRWCADTLADVQRAPFDPNWLMGVIAWESGKSFSPDVKNMAGSGATGLIQFMPATAVELGQYRKVTLSTAALARMTAEDQLTWVYWYFHMQIARHGAITNLEDCYMAVLWPSAIGSPVSAALWSKEARPTTYRQNAGLDINKDGVITKLEAATKVRQTLEEGLRYAA